MPGRLGSGTCLCLFFPEGEGTFSGKVQAPRDNLNTHQASTSSKQKPIYGWRVRLAISS